MLLVPIGIGAAWDMLASIWCAIGKARWSLGILPTLLCVLFGFAFHSFAMGGDGIYVPLFIESVVFTSIAARCFSLPLKSSSLRFFREFQEPSESLPLTEQPKRNVIPLRDLFLWTACLGIFNDRPEAYPASEIGLMLSIQSSFRS